VIDFVESLIDKGLVEQKERPVLNSAIERIRALRSTPALGKK
jgi:ERCC4-type nuclease